MKTFLLSTALLTSVCFNIYLLNTEVVVKDDLDSDIIEPLDDHISVAQSALKKTKKPVRNNSKKLKEIEKSFFPNKDSNEAEVSNKTESNFSEKDYENSQQAWKDTVTEYLEYELRVPFTSIQTYFDIQKQREQEISEYMAPKLQNTDETYLFTMEDNIEMAKINSKYLKRLQETLGEKAYREFINFRQKYNKKMIESGEGHFYIDF
ncbi:MAG: hypothetical protein QF441_15875 [Bacteriovoracaceae bacterium]|jgi:hypothetical protein|nr:hypothetical protein [Halobacteriovoraceae bacterium]MDP7322083.1 hypothetical protein [Bacteriovoracaceae bacterium]